MLMDNAQGDNNHVDNTPQCLLRFSNTLQIMQETWYVYIKSHMFIM